MRCNALQDGSGKGSVNAEKDFSPGSRRKTAVCKGQKTHVREFAPETKMSEKQLKVQ
jgi:hypothetical protein